VASSTNWIGLMVRGINERITSLKMENELKVATNGRFLQQGSQPEVFILGRLLLVV